MTLYDFVRLTRANLKMIAACMLLGALISFGFAMLQPTVYQSTATGYIGSGNAASVGDAFSGDALGSQRATTYITLVTSRPVAQQVVDDLNLDVEAEVLASRASGSVVRGAPLLKITASAPNAVEARDLADAFMEATADQAAKLETGGGEGDPVVRLIPLENALVPTSPVAPQVLRIVLLGTAAGPVLGFAIAIIRQRVDNRVRDVRDVEELTGNQALAVIPKATSIGRSIDDKRSKNTGASGSKRDELDLGIAAEALRQLRTNLRYVDVDRQIRTFVITSPNPGEGKSTIASNLARVLAASGQPTVLVDGDLRRPMQARIFKADDEVGLTQVLAGEVELADALLPTDQQLLKLLPAGRIPPNPSEVLGSKRMAAVLEDLGKDHMVLIDAPPLLPVTDAGLLAASTDGALLVLQVGKTFKEQVKLSTKVLDRVKGRLLGTVLNMANPKQMGSVLYGYGFGGYGSHYYYKSDAKTTGEVVVPVIKTAPAPTEPPATSDPAAGPAPSPWTEAQHVASNGSGSASPPSPSSEVPGSGRTIPRPVTAADLGQDSRARAAEPGHPRRAR